MVGGGKLIFETMVWSVDGAEIVEGPIRYGSESAAIEGHKWIVRELRRRNERYGGPL